MPPQKLNIQPLLEKAKLAREEYRRTGSYDSLFKMMTLYGEVNKLLMEEASQVGKTNNLQQQLNRAGDNPPPALLAKIQIATQAYQAWFTCLKSCADSKGQVQGELARFR